MSPSNTPQQNNSSCCSTQDQNATNTESVHFKHEWKPLRNFIHCTLNTLCSIQKSISTQTHNLQHNIAIPLYQSTLKNASDTWIIAQNMTREYPILLIASSGAFFAAFLGQKHRFRKFILGALLCTAVCYPDHAVRLFTTPVQYVQELQRAYEARDSEKNESKDRL